MVGQGSGLLKSGYSWLKRLPVDIEIFLTNLPELKGQDLPELKGQGSGLLLAQMPASCY
jgi:hypothetical protein